jgi:hypothetical protein
MTLFTPHTASKRKGKLFTIEVDELPNGGSRQPRAGDSWFTARRSDHYIPIIDDLDRSRALNGKFITQLRTAYNERVVKRVAARLRGTIHRTR